MVTLTPAAARRIQRLASQRPALRLAAIPGGCSGSGYQYDMQLAPGEPGDDLVYETDGVTLLVDRESYPLLQGASVDYEETLMRSGFVVRNPNAVSTCACGRSFKVTEEGEPLHASH